MLQLYPSLYMVFIFAAVTLISLFPLAFVFTEGVELLSVVLAAFVVFISCWSARCYWRSSRGVLRYGRGGVVWQPLNKPAQEWQIISSVVWSNRFLKVVFRPVDENVRWYFPAARRVLYFFPDNCDADAQRRLRIYLREVVGDTL